MDEERIFQKWLRSRGIVMVVFFLFAGLMAASFYLYGLPLAAVLYPAGLCAVIGLLFLGMDYAKTVRQHKAYLRLHAPAALRRGALPPAETVAEADAAALIKSLRQALIVDEMVAQIRYDKMIEYYTLWAHQIKTPLAAMRLTLSGEDSPTARTLGVELARTERYADMVMTYLRLDGAKGDYVFCETAVDPLVREAVKRFSGEFIAKHLTVEITESGIVAVTDAKWLSFVLEQLLSNALKYTHTGGVRIWSPESGKLSIGDSGIGIAPEDLPRIFERGYTGGSGRTDAHSSGIGLYLCRRVCGLLGIGLAATSTVGVGTTVTLDFTQKKTRFE